MDDEDDLVDGGVVGLLLSDGGGCKLLDQVFLYLEPGELKSCRLVWNRHFTAELKHLPFSRYAKLGIFTLRRDSGRLNGAGRDCGGRLWIGNQCDCVTGWVKKLWLEESERPKDVVFSPQVDWTSLPCERYGGWAGKNSQSGRKLDVGPALWDTSYSV